MKGKLNQLDLLKELHTTDTKETVFVDMLIGRVKNIAYIRTLVKFSDFGPNQKKKIHDNLSYAMENIAQLSWKLTRYNLKYKKMELSYFMAPTIENNSLYVSEPRSIEELGQIVMEEEKRLNGMMLAFKGVTVGYEPTVKRILNYFRLSTLEILNGEVD